MTIQRLPPLSLLATAPLALLATFTAPLIDGLQRRTSQKATATPAVHDPVPGGLMVDPRHDIETECLLTFEAVLAELSVPIAGRGYRATNRFDPNFGLVGRQRFQFGDLRVELPDRTVIVEVESGGGLTNLVKYWPLAGTAEKPILLLHAFGQGSLNDYVSHLLLWDYTWRKMRTELWAVNEPRLFACRFQYTHEADNRLHTAAEALRACLTRSLNEVLRQVFGYEKHHNADEKKSL